jgi:2-polyprenyl-3-methyl-5-hydroxy-6-metoxy-1,4-benzoquinol methylase
VDVSSEAIRIAKSSTVFDDSVSFEVADIENRSLTGGQFGMIVCKYVLAFINDKNSFIEYTSSLLTNDGVFVLINPDIDSLPLQKKFISLDHAETLKLLGAVYPSIESELIGNEYYYYAKKPSSL